MAITIGRKLDSDFSDPLGMLSLTVENNENLQEPFNTAVAGREAVNKSIFRHPSFRFDRFFLRTGQVKPNCGGFRACFWLSWRPLGPLFGASPATRHTSP